MLLPQQNFNHWLIVFVFPSTKKGITGRMFFLAATQNLPRTRQPYEKLTVYIPYLDDFFVITQDRVYFIIHFKNFKHSTNE